MKSLKESVLESLDETNPELFPFIPYLLQDLTEIGTDPETVINLIKKNIEIPYPLNIIDFGCGKGAVSVRLAKDLNSKVVGIDAVPEFIESAKQLAIEKGIDHLTNFIQGDIRLLYSKYTDYDVVVLGAIGPVFGDQKETLRTISSCLKTKGYVVLDDGYISNETASEDNINTTQNQFYNLIKEGGFEVIEEAIFEREEMQKMNESIFKAIKKRAQELIEKHPSIASIFIDYIDDQERQNDVLENELKCGVWLLHKK